MTIQPVTSESRRALEKLWRDEWGGPTMVSRGAVYYVDTVEGFVAVEKDRLLGAIAWVRKAEDAEIVSLNALVEDRGIGTALLDAAERAIWDHGCTRIDLVTSNDNIRALAFYQKRGYRLSEFHPGAVDAARRQKPSIPRTAPNGIPIHDEIVLAKHRTEGT